MLCKFELQRWYHCRVSGTLPKKRFRRRTKSHPETWNFLHLQAKASKSQNHPVRFYLIILVRRAHISRYSMPFVSLLERSLQWRRIACKYRVLLCAEIYVVPVQGRQQREIFSSASLTCSSPFQLCETTLELD
jgi:hypothetical protein